MPPGDYDSSSASNRHTMTVEQENLYNVNTHRKAHYSSVDELKKPEEGGSGYYDGDRGSTATSSYAYGSDMADNRRYGSLGRNTHLRDYDGLSELTPSKFGSKRESTSDYRDSYNEGTGQYVDLMPPLPSGGGSQPLPAPPAELLPSPVQEVMPPPPSGNNSSMFVEAPQPPPPPSEETPSQSRVKKLQQELQGYVERTYGERTTVGNLPFIDSSSSTNSLSSSGYWQGDPVKQQGAPHAHQFESPPTSFVQDYSPQEMARVQVASPETEGPPQQSMVVTKNERFVEMSKPFEMADFYKYSERLRKQRRSDSESPGPATPTGVQSPYMLRNMHFVQGNVPNQGHQQQVATPAYSQSRSRPTSPYSHSHNTHPQEGSYSLHKVAQPNAAPYPTRTPYVQQQGGYGQLAYQGRPSQVSPRHTSYQPLQPQTCDPATLDHGKVPHNRLV